MVISAKFSSRCAACGGPIHAGDRVEWSKGSAARHVSCGGGRAKAVASSRRQVPKTPRARREPREGEQIISRVSSGRGDGYDVGQTVMVRGHGWHTVVSAWVSPPSDDNDDFDWRCCAIVRAATAEEAVAAQERRDAVQRAKTLASIPAWVAEQVRRPEYHDATCAIPSEAWRYSLRATLAGSTTLYATQTEIVLVISSYDDGPHVWRRPLDSAAVEALGAAIAEVAS